MSGVKTEAVAWRWRFIDKPNAWKVRAVETPGIDVENQPLYAHPPAAQSEIATLRDRVAALTEALEPFVREAEARDWMALGPDIDHWPIGGSAITNGDLRRARSTLAKIKENPNG